MREILPIVIGFVLTTVVGGFLGSLFQQRSWDHQNEARLREEEQSRAGDVCHAVSMLLDKWLYRMWRLAETLRSDAQGPWDEDILDKRFQDYDGMLYEVNDRLNVNLALMGAYFGQPARDYLDFELYERFKRADKLLQSIYREARPRKLPLSGLGELTKELALLNHAVYQLSLFMMTQLRGGLVGRRATTPIFAPSLPLGRRSTTEERIA